jgi:uncharacterized protein YecT (DUF1311 family)
VVTGGLFIVATALCAADSGAGPAAATTASVPPPTLQGIWDVERVAMDLQDQIHWGYRPNDPFLLYRALTIDKAGTIAFNGSNFGCKQTRWQARSTTWGQLLARGFRRPAVGGRKPIPTAKDFDLDVKETAAVVAYQLCPAREPKASFPASAWITVPETDRVALRIDGAALLLLKRRPPEAKPEASFPCAKATTASEKAICADFGLAAWDRSVALAFKNARQRRPADDLLTDQRDWLHRRDACGADGDCIETEMIQRVRDLK